MIVKIKKKKLFQVIVLLVFLISNVQCQKPNTDEQETYNILNFLIREYTGFKADLPPPPPPYPDNAFTFFKEPLGNGVKGIWNSKKDSIAYHLKQDEILKEHGEKIRIKNYTIAIDPIFNVFSKKVNLDSSYIQEYQNLVHELHSSREKVVIDFSKVFPEDDRTTFIESPNMAKLNNEEAWTKFDYLFNCSIIVFNDDYSKALCQIGVSRSRLNGYSALVLLENQNGKWRIVHDKVLTIS